MTEHNSSAPAPAEYEAPPGAALVRLSGAIVPAGQRADWEAEWIGELAATWRHSRLAGRGGALDRARLVVRATGSLFDAVWMRGRHGSDALMPRDLRLAFRSMRRQPGFSAVVITTLALGIGGNAAIFSVVNAVLLRPLPFRDSSRLVMVYGTPTDGDSAKVGRSTSYPDYVDLRDQSRSFESLAAFGAHAATMTGPKIDPSTVRGSAVSANFFSTLGATPAMGRVMRPEEDAPGAPPMIVLSHALWQSRFNGDRGVLNAPVSLDGVIHTVIGVMPPDFRFPLSAQYWVSIAAQPRAGMRGRHTSVLVGRLARGATMERAEAEVKTIAARLEQQYPDDNAKRSARLEPMREALVRNVRPAITMLAGAVAVVLLIACTNVANLFLARAATREREAAVRLALGAGRGQLVRQLLTESVLLAALGGAAGLLVALWGVDMLVASAPGAALAGRDVSIDRVAIGFLLGVSLLTGLAFGAIPALRYARSEPSSALREAARGSSAGRMRRRFRQALVVGEVALAVLLVTGAALLAKSFAQLQDVDLGFRPERLLAVRVPLPEHRYQDRHRVVAFFDQLTADIRAMPGVERVATAYNHPLDEGWTSSFIIAGREPPPVGEEPESRIRPVSPGYFATAGIRLLRGRDIAADDVVGKPGVVIINEAFAKMHFRGEDPIGRRIVRRPWWEGMPSEFEIIGIVADERFRGLENEADPATYFAHAQFTMTEQHVMVRVRNGDPLALVPAIRQRVWAQDREIPIENVRTMEQLLDEQLAGARFNTALIGLFALVAMILAAVGVYGVLSYMVARRTTEIGIRMALGAQPSSVMRLVIGHGLALTALGVAIGVAASLPVARSLERLLFQVSPLDPFVVAAVAALLVSVAAVAAWVPARRASNVDPMIALRAEG